MRKSSKKITVLNITSRCNLRCPFCFGPENDSLTAVSPKRAGVTPVRALRKTRKDLTTAQAKNLILKLKKSGTKILIFSGGEPLLRRDIFELICFAKNLGFFTVLHTNGIKFKTQMLKVKTTAKNLKLNSFTAVSPKYTGMTPVRALSCLDQINLPLDGYNAKTNDAMRCPGHFKKVMQTLKLLRNIKIRVIISTVATAKNKDAVPKIGKILPEWIYKWRIFQFNPEGKARRVKKEFALADKEFEKIKEEISRLSARLHLPFKMQCVGLKDKKFWKSYKII